MSLGGVVAQSDTTSERGGREGGAREKRGAREDGGR